MKVRFYDPKKGSFLNGQVEGSHKNYFSSVDMGLVIVGCMSWISKDELH